MTDTPEAVRLADDFQPLRNALEAVPAGWGRMDASWPHQDTEGVAIVGALLDGEQYEVMVIDTGNYDDPANAVPLARFYAAANPSAIRSLLAERDQLRAELETVRWQPIETAPKDGTEVFVYVAGDSVFPTAASYKSSAYFEKEYGDPEYMDEGWYWSFGYPSDFHECVISPTKWMPIPPHADQKGQ